MKKLSLPAIFLFALASCVTINIYFPAEELRGAADQIARETWHDGQRSEVPEAAADPGQSTSLRQEVVRQSLHALAFFRAETAHAQAQDININTPEIRAIRESLRARSSSIIPFMDSGHIGLGNDGLLKVRTTEGLSLRDRAEVNKLVTADNNDRERLYAAIARANGFPDRVDETKSIFAEAWRTEARVGWYIEDRRGNWGRK